ncbi:MAG TPA: hypothetical protein VM431_13065 [Phycisphaerae bacterium]|nr:hypothetical protein [Phycisphaerae bacterium]
MERSIKRVPRVARVAVLVGFVGLLTTGCTSLRTGGYERDEMVVKLADALREEALRVPEDETRERLVTGLIRLREVMLGDVFVKPTDQPAEAPRLPQPEGGARPAPPWAVMFAPQSLVVGFFTRSKNFDNVPGDDGLEVRLQPLDQFGDPTKAIGSYRIEVFTYRLQSGEKRGDRLGHWFVAILDAAGNRKYYDPVDRSYVFPLLWDKEIEAGTAVIVQATYYPPGGFTEKLFAQRVVKIGDQSE